MKIKMIYKIGFIALLSAMLLIGCKEKTKTTKKLGPTTVTAKLQSHVTKLYYKGSLAPIKTSSVLSPVDGRITTLFFQYGDAIKKGQKLALINSTKLADDYRQAVTKFLQAKEAYNNSAQSLQGTEALHKAGVISDDQYSTSRSQSDTNALNFYQARYDLEKVLRKAGIPSEEIEKLQITEAKVVSRVLQRKFSSIAVKALADGVALFPVQDQSSSDDGGKNSDHSGKLAVGSEVKEGQLILSIGDLSGFSATLQVSEININRLKPGLKVVVTGDAFPGITLHGSVRSVARQANPSQSGGGGGSSLSMFNIEVAIPNITKAERASIHVGMTADFEIDIKSPAKILLPIKAVFQKDGQSMVTIIDAKTGQQKTVPVITGDTTLTDVSIVKGVKPGDKVVIHD